MTSLAGVNSPMASVKSPNSRCFKTPSGQSKKDKVRLTTERKQTKSTASRSMTAFVVLYAALPSSCAAIATHTCCTQRVCVSGLPSRCAVSQMPLTLLSTSRVACSCAFQLDRFIPSRSADNIPHFELPASKENDEAGAGESTPSKAEFNKLLAASLNLSEQSRILSFKHKAPAPPEHHQNHMASLYSSNLGAAPSRKQYRHIPTTQDRILDAPDLVNDYYLNLLDWSSSNQVRDTTLQHVLTLLMRYSWLVVR